jgi:sulfite dehydrogenase (cytochrome) subunit B
MNVRRELVCLVLVMFGGTAFAQKNSIHLPPDNSVSQIKSGAGDDVVRKNCNLCHSSDYIVRQPHLTAPQWDAEVKKMIAVYGAPISTADAKTISDYLAKNYGAESAESKKAESRKP